MKTKTVIQPQQLDDTTCKMNVGYDLSSPMVKESRRKTPPTTHLFQSLEKGEKKKRRRSISSFSASLGSSKLSPSMPLQQTYLVPVMLRDNMKIILVSVVAYNRTQWIGLPYAINYKLDLHKFPGKKYKVKMPQMTKTLSGHTQVHEN